MCSTALLVDGKINGKEVLRFFLQLTATSDHGELGLPVRSHVEEAAKTGQGRINFISIDN